MNHAKAGRQLRRTSEQRLALLRNLATSLIETEYLVTTEAKAKELRPFVERDAAVPRACKWMERREPGRQPRHGSVGLLGQSLSSLLRSAPARWPCRQA